MNFFQIIHESLESIKSNLLRVILSSAIATSLLYALSKNNVLVKPLCAIALPIKNASLFKLTCVLACADTYRAGAIEQLIEHSNRLSLKTISQSYGSDPAAVARDAIIYSKSNNIDVVLIDTAGRMQTNQNLMDEINKTCNHSNEIICMIDSVIKEYKDTQCW